MEGKPEEPHKNPPNEEAQKKRVSIYKHVSHWLLDATVATVCLLPIAYIFEHVVGIEGLDRALSVHSNLYAAVERLRPLNLLVYINDTYGYLLYKLSQIIHLTIPVAVLDFVKSLPAEIIAISKMILVFVLLFLSLMALPITVMIEWTLFDSVIVFIIFLPMWVLLVALRKGAPDDSAASNVLFGTAIAVAITIFLFWVVQLVMMGTLYVFGDLIKLAQIIVVGSLIGYVGYWAATHSVEVLNIL